jgi:hypothetical protein
MDVVNFDALKAQDRIIKKSDVNLNEDYFILGHYDPRRREFKATDYPIYLIKAADVLNGNSLYNNPLDYYLDISAPAGGNGSLERPFNDFSTAISSIPNDGQSYVLYTAPGQYNEPGPINMPNLSSITIIGSEPSNTAFNFTINYNFSSSVTPTFQLKGIVVQEINLNLGLVSFASVVFDNFSTQLLTRLDNNPTAVVQFRGGLFNSTIRGNFLITTCPIFGTVRIKPGSTVYAIGVFTLGGALFELEGDATLKTLSFVNPLPDMVNGTIVMGNTPTWLTDAASDTTFTGSVNKTIY